MAVSIADREARVERDLEGGWGEVLRFAILRLG